MSVADRVKTIIGDRLGFAADTIKSSASLRKDLGVTSVECVVLVMDMEEEFSIQIADEDMEKFITVQDMIDYIEKLIRPKH